MTAEDRLKRLLADLIVEKCMMEARIEELEAEIKRLTPQPAVKEEK